MALSEAELLAIKNYAKIDFDYEDELIQELYESAVLVISDAVGSAVNVDDPRFKLAVKKQIKEDYEQRGITSDSIRHPATGILNLIHQLRHGGALDVHK